MIILLVEDEPLIAMVLGEVLADAGHTVRGPASTVRCGLKTLESGLPDLALPDLALVDINLRNGDSGIDLARELLSRWGVPSLFISGQSIEAHANRDAALGFIGKPYSSEAVLASIKVLEHIMDGSPPPGPRIPRELELFEKPD